MNILKKIKTRKEWADFIELPWRIYKNDPYWVPPLKLSVKATLNIKKNPFFEHARMHPLGVFKEGICIGRVVGIVDENYNQFHQSKTAYFGFFETIDDPTVVNLMLDELASWALASGMTCLAGPYNPSINYECGLLIDGFNDSPTVMMTYNPPYYGPLLEQWGLIKSKDLHAYVVDKNKSKFSARLIAQAERLKARGSVSFRSLNMEKFDDEVKQILDIYNSAWEENWGFVPMSQAEFWHLVKEMKAILDPQLCLMAEVKGQTVGFALALPDINLVFKKIQNGKLFPTGLLKILWYLKGPGRKKIINRCRIVTLGIKKAYRDYGIGSLLYTEYFSRGPALGYPAGEASWILEDNKAMSKALVLMGGERTKTYRIFEKALLPEKK